MTDLIVLFFMSRFDLKCGVSSLKCWTFKN